jgi:hypothetical protein
MKKKINLKEVIWMFLQINIIQLKSFEESCVSLCNKY